jgi:hypothetical protein
MRSIRICNAEAYQAITRTLAGRLSTTEAGGKIAACRPTLATFA